VSTDGALVPEGDVADVPPDAAGLPWLWPPQPATMSSAASVAAHRRELELPARWLRGVTVPQL
jgi:hypothetical protein